MTHWSKYSREKPVNLNNLKHGKQYFYIGDDGQYTGVVTVLSIEPSFGIRLEYGDEKNLIIFPNEKQKKLFEIKKGGKRSRRHNKKYNKTKKSRRKSNRRKR